MSFALLLLCDKSSRYDRASPIVLEMVLPSVEQEPVAPATWHPVVAAHDRAVFLSLLAMGLRPDRAREIVQITWLRLIEKHGDTQNLSFPGLAIAQARFLALDALRRDKREGNLTEPYSEAIHAVPDRHAELEQRVLDRERFDRALAEIAEMSANAQRVFLLVYGGQSASAQEAASATGLSVQRVRQILSEIRARIRPLMKEDER